MLGAGTQSGVPSWAQIPCGEQQRHLLAARSQVQAGSAGLALTLEPASHLLTPAPPHRTLAWQHGQSG